MSDASARAFRALNENGLHVSFAESLTGGLIAATLISNSGASNVINESYVTYAEASKVRILGVGQDTLDTVGVVSDRCAREMAEGVRRVSGADWGVSATGIAGPDGGTPEKPVGTVYIGIANGEGVTACECHFDGDRPSVRRQTVEKALSLLADAIEGRKTEE